MAGRWYRHSDAIAAYAPSSEPEYAWISEEVGRTAVCVLADTTSQQTIVAKLRHLPLRLRIALVDCCPSSLPPLLYFCRSPPESSQSGNIVTKA